jgi:hypothetical protein
MYSMLVSRDGLDEGWLAGLSFGVVLTADRS